MQAAQGPPRGPPLAAKSHLPPVMRTVSGPSMLTPQGEGKAQAAPTQGAAQSPAGVSPGETERVTSVGLAAREVTDNVDRGQEPHN